MENRIQDTNQIIEMLKTIEPQQLMYAISQMNEVFVPQCYFTDHAKRYGFTDVDDMREGLNEEYALYSAIDDLVSDMSVDVLTDREDL